MLSLRDVSVAFDDFTAVDAVSLDLPTGRTLAVLGPSGCGKSTLLRAIAGLEEIRHGKVRFDDHDMGPIPTHRRGFALMFQDGQLFPQQSVGQNIGYPLRLRSVDSGRVGERVAELLDLVGLGGAQDRRIAGLSGGEQQRVALARALAAEPRLLLLDEPLSALDRELRERLARDLREILTQTGTTALLVTHDHDEAFAMADDIAVMMRGQLVQQGSTEQVWRTPANAEIARFLGYASVVHGEAARRIVQAVPADRGSVALNGGGVALRRSALQVLTPGARPLTPGPDAATGAPGAAGIPAASGLRGRVTRVTVLSDVVSVEVDIDGVGLLEATAPRSSVLEREQVVELGVDPSGLAWLSEAES